MIITCPCEKKQFKIDESLIPQEGRELQCGSCERVWFYKPENESKDPLTLNENISVNKIEPVIETNDINLEFSKKLQKEKIVEPEINPGLHFKVPIYHTVKKFDSRVLTLDALPQPYFTAEKKRLIVDAFVKWRITNNEQFYITSSGGQLSAMRTLLTQRVDEGLRNQFGTRTVQEVVSGERDELMNILTTDLNTVAGGELGIEVLDVRVKKIELPTEVNESVYNRMRTERERLANLSLSVLILL